MKCCLTCVYFDFSFGTEHYDYHLSVQFQVRCELDRFNHEHEDMDEQELHNLLVVGDTCEKHKKAKICTACGRRGLENNTWCPGCQQPFEEEVTC